MLGIIPAAGEGSRWGVFHKELLPIGKEIWLIDSTLEAMKFAGADKFCIVTSPNKIHTHVQHFKHERYNEFNIFYVIQKYQMDIWGAIKSALPYTDDENLFGMPDTLYPIKIFGKLLEDQNEISFGVFKTKEPKRFGVFVGDVIFNKDQGLPDGEYDAWGTFKFSKGVVSLWNSMPIETYTDALNTAIQYTTHGRCPMDYYLDFADWDRYLDYMEGIG